MNILPAPIKVWNYSQRKLAPKQDQPPYVARIPSLNGKRGKPKYEPETLWALFNRNRHDTTDWEWRTLHGQMIDVQKIQKMPRMKVPQGLPEYAVYMPEQAWIDYHQVGPAYAKVRGCTVDAATLDAALAALNYPLLPLPQIFECLPHQKKSRVDKLKQEAGAGKRTIANAAMNNQQENVAMENRLEDMEGVVEGPELPSTPIGKRIPRQEDFASGYDEFRSPELTPMYNWQSPVRQPCGCLHPNAAPPVNVWISNPGQAPYFRQTSEMYNPDCTHGHHGEPCSNLFTPRSVAVPIQQTPMHGSVPSSSVAVNLPYYNQPSYAQGQPCYPSPGGYTQRPQGSQYESPPQNGVATQLSQGPYKPPPYSLEPAHSPSGSWIERSEYVACVYPHNGSTPGRTRGDQGADELQNSLSLVGRSPFYIPPLTPEANKREWEPESPSSAAAGHKRRRMEEFGVDEEEVGGGLGGMDVMDGVEVDPNAMIDPALLDL